METLRAGHAVALCVLALLTLGIVMVTSAGLTIDPEQAVSLQGILTSRTTIYAAVAVGLMIAGAHIDPASLHRRLGARWSPAWLIVGVSVVFLVLVQFDGVGREVNGARRWINLGPVGLNLSFQPSELAKWATVYAVAVWGVTRGRESMGRFLAGLAPCLAGVMLVCGLIVVEDLGTAVLICAVAVVMLFAAGARWWHLAALAPAPLAAFIAALLTSPYRMDRVHAFIDPYVDPADKGYHMIQSMVAVSNGGATGRGLGHGVQKFGYLPEDTTDFLFAIICEELGVLGAILVVFLYGALLLAGLRILRRQRDDLGRLFALGVLLTIGFQAIINLAVVTGLAPTKGIALPLLSSGGTGWMLTALSLGVLVGMDRRSAVDLERSDESTPVDDGVVSIAAPASLAV
ncbi:MAG: FtsW/RodA/SpoVE family cell cycle protein [Phycisphaerales bacterium]